MNFPPEAADDTSLSEDTPLIQKSEKRNPFKKYVNDCTPWSFVSTVFPCILWMPKYNLKWLQSDIIAGLAVGLTVVPQGLAYAQIASLPIQYGLYSSFMGGFIYCIFGTSKDVTLGPTAIMSLLVHTYAKGDPVQAVVLTFFCGCVQLFMGIFRLGFIMRFLSVPVVSGFTSAAAITIGLGQVKHILGLKTTSSLFVLEMIETFQNIGKSNPWDIVVGVSCIVLLLLLRYGKLDPHVEGTKIERYSRYLMWILSTGRNAVVVIASAAIGYAIHTQHISSCKVTDCITLTGDIKKGLPPFKAPEFTEIKGNDTITIGDMLQSIGSGLAVVPLMGILESIAIGKAFARKEAYNLHVNQELIAIGVANLMSSFVSSYPITGSFSRTAINAQSGVKTPAGGIFTGLLVIFGLAFLTPLFHYIPKAALAAVIITAVLYMVDAATVVHLWRSRKLDLLPLLATFLVCFWQIPYGIIAGVMVSMLMLICPLAFPSLSSSSIMPVTGDASARQSLIISIQSGLTFPSVENLYDYIVDTVCTTASKETVSKLILDFQHVSTIDYSVAQTFSELTTYLETLNIQLVVVSARQNVREVLINTSNPDSILFFKDVQECLLVQE